MVRITYADYFTNQVIDAAHVEVPNIREIFQRMSERMTSATIGKDKFADHIKDLLSNISLTPSKFLKLLYDLSAIGVLSNQRKFSANYLIARNFLLKDNDQIVFHPAISVKLCLDIAITGHKFKEEDTDIP